MEAPIWSKIKKYLSNPKYGMKFTNAILENGNKIEPFTVEVAGEKIELIQIGFSEKDISTTKEIEEATK